MIKKVANLKINYTRNYSNRLTTIDVQVQIAGDSTGTSHQNLLSGWMIGKRYEEVPVLVPLMEPIIISNNQPSMPVSTGVVQAPQSLKMTVMQEFIAVTTLYNTGVNRNPRRVSITIINDSTPASSGSGTSAISRCPSSTPTYVCVCNVIIENIFHNDTPNFRGTS